LVEDESDVVEFEEDVVAFEHLLQVAVAELSDQVDLIEVVQSLPLGNQHLDHPHDVGVLAVLQQHYLPQYATSLR
jgi:hypothetical protein